MPYFLRLMGRNKEREREGALHKRRVPVFQIRREKTFNKNISFSVVFRQKTEILIQFIHRKREKNINFFKR